MGTSRMMTFSDAVLAIIITIMVLELKPPQGVSMDALTPLAPMFLSYVLSFAYIGIYWNNHHHLLHAGGTVTALVLWTNLHLLFWLSLLPFATSWMGEHEFAPVPTALYGAVLCAAAVAYLGLQQAIIRSQGAGSRLKAAIGADWKGKVSLSLYLAGIATAFLRPWLGQIAFAAGAMLWLVPDRRLEHSMAGSAQAT